MDGASFLGFSLKGGSMNATQAFRFYRDCAAVATAVDMIADEVEQIEPIIKGPDGQLISRHAILDLLRKPNPAQGYRSFMGDLIRSWLLTHDVFVAAEGNVDRLPINLWAVKPVNVSVNESATDRFALSIIVPNGPAANEYERVEKNRQWRFIANRFAEIHRTMGFSSRSGAAFPDSPLAAAATDIHQQVTGKQHNLKLMENGGRLSLVAVFKDTMSPEQHVERRERLTADIGGSDNAGKMAVISSEDLELKEFGSSNKDMDYENLDKISSTAIFMRYKIPLPLISTDASTYNNMEQSKYDLYDRCVLPAFAVIAEGLSNFLLPKGGLDPAKFQISFDPEQINALRTRMLDELKKRKDLNLETINELRSMLPNREPLTEGADKLYQPGTLLPIGDDIYTADNLNDLTERARARVTTGDADA